MNFKKNDKNDKAEVELQNLRFSELDESASKNRNGKNHKS
jgi:hypothetical protein